MIEKLKGVDQNVEVEHIVKHDRCMPGGEAGTAACQEEKSEPQSLAASHPPVCTRIVVVKHYCDRGCQRGAEKVRGMPIVQGCAGGDVRRDRI